jgi:Cytochrome c554 and c-prime
MLECGVLYMPPCIRAVPNHVVGAKIMCAKTFLVAAFLATLSASVFAAQAAAPQSQPSGRGQVGMYSGPGSCAASNCHGSVAQKTVTRIWQNEYSIWAAQDKHARAYAMLSNPVSMRMARILKLQTSPNQADKCLVCHTLDVAPNLRAQSSCENCHGPAVGWLGPHTARGWTHEQSLKLGMYDTRDLVARSEKCMTCHVGTAEKRVDHEMIAAGHPDLTFELDTFSAVMPRHWKFPDNQNPWEGVQEWAIGQGVQLRETLNRLSRASASNTTWPEFAELECFACHHSLTQPQDSWRQAAGYPGRTPGAPAWNASRYIVFRDLVSQVSPQTSKQLDSNLDQVSMLVGSWGDREKISAAAKNASAVANEVVQQIRRQQYDSHLTARIMQAIAGDGSIAPQGERSAEQAAMALDSLSIAYQKNDKIENQSDLRAAIDRLFQQLNNPSAYNAPTFAAQMQKVKSLLPRGSQTADLRP